MSISDAQMQAYLLWLNQGSPPGSLGDAFLGGPLVSQPTNLLQTYATLSALKAATPPTANTGVVLLGKLALGDTTPIFYVYDTTSTATGDDATVIVPSANPTNGRYIMTGTV